ncbi:peptidyl-prolyl cis-trans isomerase FKBP16-1, chloroplastic isoform X2 [Coffea eugenioides]|uniref:peptidylprolyl isomerase n=1 Tax=Coffea arabica TaxID=13443 RepID=A0A6P6S750_COFAR|nr:peptidyl-prolyl cis-trans isomerase FKBP16-1, chloroplastic-like isoform X2 [Coffea arabica]XP_027170100.1 peptidyl-prolyl cis-trans isomerase FKBP16-1, chloroplastic isoform X2 [Coffea eugenioides]
MGGPAYQTRIRFPIALASPSCLVFKQPRVVLSENLGEKVTSIGFKKVPRRSILQLMVFAPIFATANTILAAPMQEMNEPDVVRTLKLPSGVRIQGKGREASEGDLVEINYVCRRSNGYFVHSTVDKFSGESAPVILSLDDKQIIKGLKEVLIGMKAGGKRRALIPPSVGYISENLAPVPEEFGPRRSLLSHAKEPLIFEVQLLKVL